MLKYKVQRTTAYAATTLTVSTVFHLKPRCHANMVTLDTPTCSTCSETFPAWLSRPKPNEFLHFDLESCNLMCTYTVVTHPCHMPPLAQARPMMLCIYTSYHHSTKLYRKNITSLLPSVLLRVSSTSNNANGNKMSDIFSGTMVIMIFSYEPSISLHVQTQCA